jgi:hypothetical protein
MGERTAEEDARDYGIGITRDGQRVDPADFYAEPPLLVDELANELRRYRHSKIASAALAEHILAIPRIHDALTRPSTPSEDDVERMRELLAKVVEELQPFLPELDEADISQALYEQIVAALATQGEPT